MKIFRRYKLVAPASLMLAAILFAPPVWCGDSTVLAGIANRMGASRSAGGEFDKLAALPEEMWMWIPGYGNALFRRRHVNAFDHFHDAFVSFVVMYKGQPCVCYTAETPLRKYNALLNGNGGMVKVDGNWPVN
jgi:hypothetical protein